jgi:hypothetical protein
VRANQDDRRQRSGRDQRVDGSGEPSGRLSVGEVDDWIGV